MAAAAEAGAIRASYILMRLPHEVAPLFGDWLQAHVPDRAARVMAAIRQMRGGRDYDAAWGTRMKGAGPYARLLAQRFRVAARRLGLNAQRMPLDATQFLRGRGPEEPRQMSFL